MSVLKDFQRMFDDFVLPFIDELNLPDEFAQPLLYTLKKESNKFRSATALLAAKISGGSYSDVLPIAAVSEIIHNSIIIQDDIADSDIIRRGKEAAWKKYGLCYALYSSLYVIPSCLRILSDLECHNVSEIENDFLEAYQAVCCGQIGQSQLILDADIPYSVFLNIHTGKTSIGIWSISSGAVACNHLKNAQIFREFARLLGDAASIKNDLEDFFQEDDYEPFCTDIRQGNLTYPLYHFFSKCTVKERSDFLEVFGKNIDADYHKLKELIRQKGTEAYCLQRIRELVKEALGLLSAFPASQEKQLLEAWANYHVIE